MTDKQALIDAWKEGYARGLNDPIPDGEWSYGEYHAAAESFADAYAATLRQQAGAVDDGHFVRCKACNGKGQCRVVVATSPGSFCSPPEDHYEVDTCPDCQGAGFVEVEEPQVFQDLRYWMKHCASACDEGEDFAISREVLDALTTLGLMKKAGRGKWRPTDAGSKLAERPQSTLARPASSEPASGEAVAYFSADPLECEFNTHKTLAEAIKGAEGLLESAQDNASDYGWEDEPPQICYGVVLGRCHEVPGSRRPAPEGSEFTELVDFQLAKPTHYTHPAEPVKVPEASAELIEQRDALATALVELTRVLPKGAKSLSQIAQQRRAAGETIAYAVLNREDVDPAAYDRMLEAHR